MSDPNIDIYLNNFKNEILYSKNYIQLLSVIKYKYRAGEIWKEPFYPPKFNDNGIILRAIFFVTTNGVSKIINVLYRAFGYLRRKTDLIKISKEIERRAHLMFYNRGNKKEEIAMRQIRLNYEDWCSDV